MIIRKPYAFLIKNFKRIHGLLTIMMAYVIYRSSNILSFFNEFVVKRTFSYTGNLAESYINIYLYLIIIFILLITLIIFILMRQKKKPTFLYLSIIVFYLIILVVFFIVYNNLVILEIASLSPQKVRVIRDVVLIVTIVQYLIIIFIAVRAVGFDIKKFNFGEDLQQLEIDVSDDEEVELTVGIDPTTIGRRVRRQKRELRYFIKENIFILSLITIIVVVISVLGFILNKEVYNKIYIERELFKVNDFVVRVADSYVTRHNYRGKKIAPKDKAYVIVSIDVENRADENRTIKLEDIRLFTNHNSYNPLVEKYQSFFDLGVGYTNQIIKGKEQRNFILVFEVNDKELNDEIIFRFTESVYFSRQSLQAKYRRVRLMFKTLDNKQTVGKYQLEDKINFAQSLLKNSLLTIEAMEINNKFLYDALICIQDECSNITKLLLIDSLVGSPKILLKLLSFYKMDQAVNYLGINNVPKLITTFGKLRFKIGDNYYESLIKDMTPFDCVGNNFYFEVPEKIKNADSIDLIMTIRNKEYILTLK